MKQNDLLAFDQSFHKQFVIGVDEVGRGCLAGPLVAASVIIDTENLESIKLLSGINDSKQLTAKKRETLEPIIKDNLDYKIISFSSHEIDQQGVEIINQLALSKAITAHNYSIQETVVLVDGNGIRNSSIDHKGIIKGDSKSLAVACASVIAKVYRDQLMIELFEQYPEYQWQSNKGYGSKVHQQAILEHGLTDYHRRSFCRKLLSD
jgi:ribonuclease HII